MLCDSYMLNDSYVM